MFLKAIRNTLLIFIFTAIIYSCNKVDNSIAISKDVEEMFAEYTSAWSNADFEKITNEIYDLPFYLFEQDTTIIYNSKYDLKLFLKNSFKTLEKNDYGYSVTNNWEHYKLDGDIAIIEMNYTRFLKDSTVMGAANRKATYVLRKSNDNFKISALIPHTPIDE